MRRQPGERAVALSDADVLSARDFAAQPLLEQYAGAARQHAHDVLPAALEPVADIARGHRLLQAGRLRLSGDDSRDVEDKGQRLQRLRDRSPRPEELLVRGHQNVPVAGHLDDGEPVGCAREAGEEQALTAMDYHMTLSAAGSCSTAKAMRDGIEHAELTCGGLRCCTCFRNHRG